MQNVGNGYSGRQTRPKTPVHITARRGSTPMVNPVLVGISFGHPPVAVLGQHLSQDPAGPLQVPLIKVFLRHPTRSATPPRPTRTDLNSRPGVYRISCPWTVLQTLPHRPFYGCRHLGFLLWSRGLWGGQTLFQCTGCQRKMNGLYVRKGESSQKNLLFIFWSTFQEENAILGFTK